jgi:hypothetical protein
MVEGPGPSRWALVRRMVRPGLAGVVGMAIALSPEVAMAMDCSGETECEAWCDDRGFAAASRTSPRVAAMKSTSTSPRSSKRRPTCANDSLGASHDHRGPSPFGPFHSHRMMRAGSTVSSVTA